MRARTRRWTPAPTRKPRTGRLTAIRIRRRIRTAEARMGRTKPEEIDEGPAFAQPTTAKFDVDGNSRVRDCRGWRGARCPGGRRGDRKYADHHIDARTEGEGRWGKRNA